MSVQAPPIRTPMLDPSGIISRAWQKWFVSLATLIVPIYAKNINALTDGIPATGQLATIPIYANNAAAITGGLVAGDLYRTGADPDALCIVH